MTRTKMRIQALLPTQAVCDASDNFIEAFFSPKDEDILPLTYPLARLSYPVNKTREVSIAVLGDSFVYGCAMQNINNCFWRQLEYELERRGYDCAVNAVGVGGATAEEEYLWLSQSTLLWDLQPDIVLFGYVYNDPEIRHISPSYTNPNAASFFKQSLLETTQILYPNLGYLVESKTAQNVVYHQWCQELVETENLALFEDRVVSKLAAFSERKKLPVAVVTLPTQPNEKYYELFYAPVQALYEEYNIPFYNSLYSFCNDFADTKHSDNYYVNPIDGHPGTSSSYFFAQYIADFLERDYAYILGEKNTAATKAHTVELNDWMPFTLSVENKASSTTAGEFTFTYPAADEERTFMMQPLQKDYVELSFAYPVDITSLTLESDAMQSVEIYTVAVNPALGYDDLQPVLLGSGTGTVSTLEDTQERMVTSLYIHMETKDNKEAACTLSVRTTEGGVSLWTK